MILLQQDDVWECFFRKHREFMVVMLKIKLILLTSVMIFFTFFNLVCTGYFTLCNVTYLTRIRSKSSKPLF